jgi:hypothetical protein
VERNQNRIKNGGHGKTTPEEKIIRNNEQAREVYNTLKDSTLVDISKQVKV